MRTSGKVLKDFENLRKALFDEEISHMAFMRDGKIQILYTQKYVDKLEQEIERLNNIINELEKDIEQQITFCTNEADATTNDKYCRIAINYLKHLKNKIKELKGDGSNGN